MKLINKTEFDSAYLRKVITWVREQVGLGPDWIKQIVIKPARTRDWGWSWCNSHYITITVKRGNNEGLAWAMGYTFGYLAQRQDGARRNSGPVRKKAAEIVAAFKGGMDLQLQADAMKQDDIDMLCAKVGIEGYDEAHIKAPKVKPTPVQRRAKKAAQDLARWERKLKLAEGKVAKLKRRVAYYSSKGQ